MSDALEPWKRKGVRKGRIRDKLLLSGPAPIEALLALAKLDDPNATEQSLNEVLRAARHKFYCLDDGRWGAYPDEEVRTIYRPTYDGEPKKRKKTKDRGKLKGRDRPEAPVDGRLGFGDDGISSVILMGDELVMTGTPRLLIEFKAEEERVRDALRSALEEDTPVRFFAKEGGRIVFIGTRSILDLVQERSGNLRVIASPAADDARRAIAPSAEQRLLLETRQDATTLPVPLDGSVVIPYVPVPELSEDERRTLSIPSSPRPSDFSAIRGEFMPIRARLESDSSAWQDVLAFLNRKRPLVDARVWEKLLLMALNSPNARCIDLVEILDLYLSEDPSPKFSLHVVRALSRSGDPEGKIAVILEDYAEIAQGTENIDRTGSLALARAFYRCDNRFDETARNYAKALDSGESLPPEDLVPAIDSFIQARNLGTEIVQGFLSYLRQTLLDGDTALPDVPGKDFISAIGSFLCLIERYCPGELLEVAGKIIGYLTAVQADEAALRWYDQYRPSIRKAADLLDLLSCFETCESTETLNQACERLWQLYAERRETLTPALIESVAQQFEIVEGMLGRETLYAEDAREWLSKLTTRSVRVEEHKLPLLKEHGINAVAVYGGNEVYRTRMKELLQGLGATKVIPIPPSFESHIDQGTLKEKIRGVDLVLQVATYTKHADHYMLQNLKNSPDVSFRIIRVNGGPSRGLHELKIELAS